MINDSRYAATQYYLRKVWPLGLKASYFVLALVCGAVAVAIVSPGQLGPQAQYTLFVLVAAVVLWVSEAIPPFATGIFIMAFLVFMMGSIPGSDAAQYVNTWSSPVIWLMLGGFFISEGMRRTGLDAQLFSLAVKIFGSTAQGLLLGLMIMGMLASMVMSNTATTAMMIGAILPFLKTLERGSPLSKALLIGIPTAAALGGMGTIIGSPPNAITVGVLETSNIRVDFVEWMLYGIPLALTFTFAFWVLLSRSVWDMKVNISLPKKFEPGKAKHLQRAKRIVAYTLLVTLFLWMTTPVHGIHVAAIGAIPIVALTITGIIRAKDLRRLPWETLMLVAGGLSLGLAIDKSGLAAWAADLMRADALNPWLVILLFGYVTALVSNVMSNTAAVTVLVPVGALVAPDYILPISLVIGLCASTALLLPVSTPPNAIAYSTGLLDQKDFRKFGGYLALLGPPLITLWVAMIV